MAIDTPAESAPTATEPQQSPATIPDEAGSASPAPAEIVPTDDAPEESTAPPGPEGEAGAGNPPPDSIVVQCPNCQTSFSLTAQSEVEIPPLSGRYMTCPECQGTTMTRTGAGPSGDAVIKCEGCGGAGYLRKDGAPAQIGLPSTMQPPWEGAQWDAERELWV